MSTDRPAAKAMGEAIELAIDERSPYPEKAALIDAHEPYIGEEIRHTADEGCCLRLYPH
ncbi:MAG TPA: hypothetical protein VGP17_08475 [Solirubrobacteraceae bacterium]|jgi:hypothetical protein|nr:hypothetical protein [Solirubrobacteraceae bacterium]